VADSRQSFRVFVSSPGDVAEERQLVRQVADELNDDPLLRGVAKFEIVGWEDSTAYAPLSATLTPQEAISRGIYRPSECDVLIVILWSRMGTPLPDEYRKQNGSRYLSAVEWEYEDAYTASPRPDILVFRRTEAPRLAVSDQNLEEKVHQYRLVEQFFARFRAPDGSLLGAFNAYETPSEFRESLKNALSVLVRRRAKDIKRFEERAIAATASGPVSTGRESVFISYSHADAVWLERLKVHLAPLVKERHTD
jgi:hypothetical protein